MKDMTSKQIFCACIDQIRKCGTDMCLTEKDVEIISMLIVKELNENGESPFLSSSVNAYGLYKQIDGELTNIKISNDEVFNDENTLKIEELYMWLSLIHEYYLTGGRFTGNPYRRFVSMSRSLHKTRNMPGERECADLIKKIDKMVGYLKNEKVENEISGQCSVVSDQEEEISGQCSVVGDQEIEAEISGQCSVVSGQEIEAEDDEAEDETEDEAEIEDEAEDEAEDDEAEAELEVEYVIEAEEKAEDEEAKLIIEKANAQVEEILKEAQEKANAQAEEIIKEAQEKANKLIENAEKSAGKLLSNAENGATEYLDDYISFARRNKKAIGAFVKTDRANVRKEVVTTRSSIEKIKQSLDNTQSAFNGVENALALISSKINDTVCDITGKLNDIASEIEYKSTENALSQFSQIYDQISATYNAYLYGHNNDMVPKFDILNRLLMFQEIIECCLEDYGLTSFETEAGEKFDVRLHKAKTQSYNYDPRSSYVTKSLKKGFMWGDIVKVKEEVEIGPDPYQNSEGKSDLKSSEKQETNE